MPVFIIFIALVILVLVRLLMFTLQVGEAKRRAATFHAYSRIIPKAKKRLLMVGDSIGVGVGVPVKESFAGRFAKEFPKLSIDNKCVSGSTKAAVEEQVRSAKGKYDVVLIIAGGNDILSFTSPAKVRAGCKSIIGLAKEKGKNVVFFHGGRIDVATIFPWFVGKIFLWQQRRVVRALHAICDQEGVPLIDLLEDEEYNNLYLNEPEMYFSSDNFHPSGAAYGVLYKKVREYISF